MSFMYKKHSQVVYFLTTLLTGIVVTGCAGPHVYIHPNPGLDTIKKIAVMPFDNFSKDDKASEKVRNGFVIELLRTCSFNVIDVNETDRRLREAGLSYNTSQNPAVSAPKIEKETADSAVPLSKSIGEILDVTAILVGSVETYSSERIGDQIIPEVSISARLIDAETGIIIWASTYTRRGGTGIPIFGWGKITSLGILSQQVIREMVNSLAEYIP